MAKVLLINALRGTADTRVRITGNDITFDGLGATFAENNVLSSCTKNWDWQDRPAEFVKPISSPIYIKGSVILEMYYNYEEGGPEFSSGVIPFVIKAEHLLDFFNENSTYPMEVIPYFPEDELPAGTYAYQFKAKSLDCEFTIYAADGGSSINTIIDLAEGTIALSEAVPESGVYGYLTKNVEVPPPVIEATYNSFLQEMTVLAPTNTAVTTTDINGNILGSGNTGSVGSVTYKIDEGMLPGGSVLSTQAPNSNIVDHNLVASFYVASDVVGQNVEFNVIRDHHREWLDDYPGNEQGLSATLSGEMIVEYSSGEQHIVNLEDHRNKRWGFIVDELGVHDFDVAANPSKVGLVSAKVRFRNLNDKVYIAVAQATHIYKFFDDGVSDVGYQLASRDSRPSVVIKQLPTSLPTTLRNLNSMFWGDSDSEFIFADAQVESVLSSWDVSNVVSMVSTFSYAKYHTLPITNWVPTNLKYLMNAFGYATSTTTLNWSTPSLIDTSFAFEGPHFTGNVNLTMDNVVKADAMFIDNNLFTQDISGWCVPHLLVEPADFNRDGILTAGQKPVWGTCPGRDLFELYEPQMTKAVYVKTDTSKVMWIDAQYEAATANGKLYIDWGDGNKEIFNPSDFAGDGYYFYVEHPYAANGEYTVKVYSSTKTKWIELAETTRVLDWGNPENLQLQLYSDALIEVPTTLHPNMTDLTYLFGGCSNFNQDISGWDVSKVTNMSHMFSGAASFNQNITGWDVSNVTDMSRMFEETLVFNQPIGTWNVGNVTNMGWMFKLSNFNQPIETWDTSKVTNMSNMFEDAKLFNRSLELLDVSNVTDMYGMFAGAIKFNSPINGWDVSKVTDMAEMFRSAPVFDQPLNYWQVSAVTTMNNMFESALAFNKDLSGWCVSNIATLPNKFNTGGVLQSSYFPVWGTCPAPALPDNVFEFSVATASSATYRGAIGDVITFENGNVHVVQTPDEIIPFSVGRHRVVLSQAQDRPNTIAMNNITELHNFPTLSTIKA